MTIIRDGAIDVELTGESDDTNAAQTGTAQLGPDHEVAHVHTAGAEQIPPFMQA